MGDTEAFLEKIADIVVAFEDEEIETACQEAIDAGVEPLQIVMDGLGRGMMKAGVLFEQKEYFVPELLLCADTMNLGMDLVQPLMTVNKEQKKCRVVIGTIQGDVHTIGKNLVKLMSEINGFEVIDLGADVPLEKFVEEQQKANAEIVAISAMMTATMMGMKKVIPMVRAGDPTCGIIIGGAPVTSEVARLFGADGFADSAAAVVAEMDRMLVDINRSRAEALAQQT